MKVEKIGKRGQITITLENEKEAVLMELIFSSPCSVGAVTKCIMGNEELSADRIAIAMSDSYLWDSLFNLLSKGDMQKLCSKRKKHFGWDKK